MTQNITDIATAMRFQEAEFDYAIPENRWIVVRLDGRGFSSLTEQCFIKPFDNNFHALMVHTAASLLTQLQGIYCYTGSDEISLVLPPNWDMFDRRLEKIVSISASIASATFSMSGDELKQLALFDSRIIAFPSLNEVIQYCSWRLADVRRCAMHTLAYWTLRNHDISARNASKILNGIQWQEKDKMLQEKYSINFNEIALWKQQGIGIHWEIYEKTGFNPIKNEEVIAERRRAKVVDVMPNVQYEQWLSEVLQKEII